MQIDFQGTHVVEPDVPGGLSAAVDERKASPPRTSGFTTAYAEKRSRMAEKKRGMRTAERVARAEHGVAVGDGKRLDRHLRREARRGCANRAGSATGPDRLDD